jgi:hypothetical protein
MHHFVQYHNFDKMGPYRTSRKSFDIVTSKCFSSLLGGTVWLVMGKVGIPMKVIGVPI